VHRSVFRQKLKSKITLTRSQNDLIILGSISVDHTDIEVVMQS